MFLILLITAILLGYLYIKWHYSYWQRKGFPYLEAKTFFGVLEPVRQRERSMGTAIFDAYKNSEEQVLGIYMITRPALLVRDAKLARDMLAQDFKSFHDRGVYVDEENDPLSGQLFNLRGQKWKTMRAKLTPSFTSGKLKGMFGTTEDIADKMLAHLEDITPPEGSSATIELKKLLATYAIDIIASVIFGLDVNSFKDPTNEFYKVSTQINQPNATSVLRGTCQFLYPSLEQLFQRCGWAETAHTSMRDIARKTIALREQNNIVRQDMLQLLLQLRNSGKINEDDSVWSVETAAENLKHMSVDMIAAQLFIFYVAGYETTASTASFTIYELSQNQELYDKVQKDIDEVLTRHGKLTYEALNDMKYLDLCIQETIRKYPGLPILNRECTERYTIPGTDKVIEKGTPIIISLLGIHRDAAYFPHPDVYDPERFLESNNNYDSEAYMPFGEGPRRCIAWRMGKINAKMAMVKILTNFNIEVSKERKELEFANFGVPLFVKGGINVRLSKKRSANA